MKGIPGAQDGPLLSASRGGGCKHCRGSGYRGRTGLFEVLDVTPALRDTIQRGSAPRELEDSTTTVIVPTTTAPNAPQDANPSKPLAPAPERFN